MSKEITVAAIDLGSNSVLMLIAKCSQERIELINEYFAVTRLGENASINNILTDDAINRTIDAATEMQQIAVKEGCDDLIITATSAVRNAENKTKFLVKCHQRLKIYPQVLSGTEEAKLTFLGATHELSADQPVVLIDVGGGSTEIAYGLRNKLAGTQSVEVGCVKLTELFDLSRKLTYTKQYSAQNHIRKLLLPFKYEIGDWALKHSPQVIVSGGTATTYAAILKNQPVYDRAMINMTKSNRRELIPNLKRIGKMDIKRRQRIPGMEAGRAEIFPAGLLLISTILNFFSFDEFSITTDGLRLGTICYFIKNKDLS